MNAMLRNYFDHEQIDSCMQVQCCTWAVLYISFKVAQVRTKHRNVHTSVIKGFPSDDNGVQQVSGVVDKEGREMTGTSLGLTSSAWAGHKHWC